MMIHIIIYFVIILLIFVIIYNVYQSYFINKLNYNSYINLDNIKPIDTAYAKMNVAVILTGDLSNQSTLSTQKYFIYDQLKPDIYCSFANNVTNTSNKSSIIKPHINLGKDLSEYETVYELNKIIEKQPKKYDVIIRIRSDVYVKSPLPANILNNVGENTIYVPKSNNFLYYSTQIGINDYFCICNQKTFRTYAGFYRYLRTNNQLKCKIVEYVLKQYLLKNEVKINDNFEYETVIYKLRTNQLFYPYVLLTQYIKKFDEKFHCIID